MSPTENTSKGRFAHIAPALAQRGFKVFPVQPMVKDAKGEPECGCMSWKRKKAKEYGETAQPCDRPGKHPLGVDSWTKRASIDPAQIDRWANKYPNANIGIVTGGGFFVLDVDGPEGKAELAKLIVQYGDLPPTWKVRTGSGGAHLYFRAPEGVSVPNSASTLAPKLDIRGDGGFVVGPNSIHRSGGVYIFEAGCSPNDLEIALAPEWLLDRVVKGAGAKHRAKASGERKKQGSRKKPNACGLEEHLNAIGDAVGQSGFDGPINSACCAYFADEGADAPAAPLKEAILAKVDSAYKDPQKSRDRYHNDDYLDERIEKARAFISSQDTKAGRAGESSFEFSNELGLVSAINEFMALVLIGGHARYLVEHGEDVDFLNKEAAKALVAPYHISFERDVQDGFEAWQKSPSRRMYRKVVFSPGGAPPSAYNLWKGFAVEPRKGDWSLMRAHVRDVICAGNARDFEWVLGWIAQMLQDPSHKPGTLIAMRGSKGIGKSTLTECLGRILGPHAVTVDKPDLLIGKFNGHLHSCLLLNVEEGFWAGDRQAEGVLKNLITGETFMMERKGVDAVRTANHVHLIISSNFDWVVPATSDERRFFVLDVADTYKGNSAYFSALRAEIDGDGPAAMLHDLLALDYSHLDLRNPPRTAALIKQIVTGLPFNVQWLYSVLQEAEFGAAYLSAQDSLEWFAGPLSVQKQVVHDSYNAHVPRIKGADWPASVIGKFLHEAVPGLETVRPGGAERSRSYIFPPLSVLRAAFTAEYGVEFPDEGDGVMERPEMPESRAPSH